ncbi:UDP-glucuronosyltransferase, partial [Gryllus bimaculatus]
MNKFAVVVATLLLVGVADAAKILVLMPVPAKSHFGAYAPLFEELARRGHEVTVASPFPRKTPLANYTDIVLEDTFPARDSKEFNTFEMREAPFPMMMYFIFKICSESCEKVLQLPNMQKLINSKDLEFDLVLYEPFFTECTYGLLHKFKAPKIQLVPNSIIPWSGDPVGNPSTLSYIPILTSDTGSLDFMGRFSNFMQMSFLVLFRTFIVVPTMDSIMRKHFPDPTIPSIDELETDTAFLFLHSHPALNNPRPLTPNTIELGALHVKEKGKLPQDLQKFLDDAPHGVIYFSLGSNVRSVDMPEAKRNSFIQAFSKLKQKVLWKWEADSLPGQPKNVRLGKWLPQHDILAHPNVKLFITHGGLMSTQEATYFGVPLVAVPIMADQKVNALRAENSGYAVVLDVHNITEESVSWALNQVLNEPRYRENAKRLSSIITDQPQKPLEKAVFWVEYAIRHGGAPHLRSAALKLNPLQYYFLDVIAVLALIVLAVIVLTTLFVRAVVKTQRQLETPKDRGSRNIGGTVHKKTL